MVWDFFSRGSEPSFYETAYGPLGYARRYDGVEMVRMPVEADVEYLFVEGVYFAWKSTADDAWMARQLDAAIRAMDYSFTDRARFSAKHGLVKRGYTIDTWDFQVDDATTRLFPRWGTLLVDPDRSKFGVMFGDNTGYAASCSYLAEMLERAGRPREADRFRERGRDVRQRLDRVAWLGTHFRHWVPEDETVVRDLGVNEREQVSLSNTYSLNRGIRHEQAAAILRTYQGIRSSLPPGSPGEWYAIYPPFAKGFGDHSEAWQYVNGGVSPIFAGELARGAFVHGFEAYGADILSRVLDLTRSSGEQIWFAYTGAYPAVPEPRFTPVDLAKHANMDLGGTGAPGVPSWMAAMPDDHLGRLPTGRQDFAGVPFLVADPATNGRRGAARRLAPPRVPGAGLGAGGGEGGLDLRPAQRRERRQPEDRGRPHLRLRGRHGGDAVRGPGPQRLRLVVPVPRGLVAGRLRLAAAPPAREARLAREKRRLPERRDLLVRARQPAPGPGDPVDRLHRGSRRGHLRGGGPDPRRPAAPPEAAGGVLRRPRQLGGGGGRVRPRRGTGRRRGPGRRVPRRRRSPRGGPRPGRTRRRSSSTTRPRTATSPTTTATTPRSGRSRSR